MALQLGKDFDSGLTAANAYHRIVRCDCHLDSGDILIDVSVYKDEAARRANKPFIEKTNYVIPYVPDATGTLLAIAYNGLKALPQFSGASDV